MNNPTHKRAEVECVHEGPSEYKFLTEELIGDILYADLYSLRGKTEEQKLKVRDQWLEDYLRCEYRIPQTPSTEMVFFRSLSRNDYRELFHSVIEEAGTENFIVIEDYKKKTKKMNVEASRHLLDVWPLISLIMVDDPIDRACCFIRLCMYTFILKKIRRIKFDVLVCFADMQPVEHLAAYYFRSLGVPTVTLQHGLYVEYGDLDTVNVINYLHQPSQYFLAWGDSTAALIRKYHPDTNVVVCGKPLVSLGNMSSSSALGMKKYVMVFFDQKVFDELNEEMLRIVISYCDKAGLQVRVRFHPSLNKGAYLRKYPEIREAQYFMDAEFIVGHTSSLIYEAIALGCKVFRYQTSIPAVPLPSDYSFRSERELASRLQADYRKPLNKNYIAAINRESRVMYRNFFQKLLASLGDGSKLVLNG